MKKNIDLHSYLKTLTQNAFNELKSDEELSVSLHSEDSQFYRFNQSKVRQNTSVNQHEVYFVLNKNLKTVKSKFNLTLNPEHDLKKTLSLLKMAREQSQQ